MQTAMQESGFACGPRSGWKESVQHTLLVSSPHEALTLSKADMQTRKIDANVRLREKARAGSGAHEWSA